MRAGVRYSLLSPAYNCHATPICFIVLRQTEALALSLALLKAGSKSAARIAMMATTTSNSMRVKAREGWKAGRLEDCDGLPPFHFSILPLLLIAASSASSTSHQVQADIRSVQG